MPAITEPIGVTPNKMKPEAKAKWLARLRDPGAKQVRHFLRRPSDNAMCCLGHLCDVVEPEHWDTVNPNAHRHGYIGMPGPETYDAAGLSNGVGQFLARMNDKLGATLPEIADWIEANL